MRLLPALALAAITLLFSVPAPAADTLTEAGARAVVVAMEQAAKRNDLPGVVKFVADDAVLVSIRPEPDGKTVTTTWTKAQYLEQETQAQQKFPGSRYESTAPRVSLSGDGRQATATYTTTQQFMQDQQQIVTTADQIATVELRGDRPLVTRVTSTLVGLSIDGKKIF